MNKLPATWAHPLNRKFEVIAFETCSRKWFYTYSKKF